MVLESESLGYSSVGKFPHLYKMRLTILTPWGCRGPSMGIKQGLVGGGHSR